MSLRLRLALAVVAVAAVMAVASYVTTRLNRTIGDRVTDLARLSSLPLEVLPDANQTLSIEGRWDGKELFVAEEIERLPRSRRPQLRGPISALDAAAGTIVLHGRSVRITSQTEIDRDEGALAWLAAAQLGQRVEASCQVEASGAWLARKLETRGVKESDKVKGRVTGVDLTARPLRRLDIEGLAVGVPADVAVSVPQGPLYRMEMATQMTLAIEEGLAAAQELLKLRYSERDRMARAPDDPRADLDAAIADAEDRLEDAAESLAHYLDESLAVTRDEEAAARARGERAQAGAEVARIERWLAPLEQGRRGLEQRIDELEGRAGRNLEKAQAFMDRDFVPFVDGELGPLVRGYQHETEGELGLRLESIAADAEGATRRVLVANLAGIAIAVASGLLLVRSISRPIGELRDAAQALGRGELSTSVPVRSRDELGVLAETFNRMARDLAASTVSVARLDNVIDSMAGALLIVDEGGRITSVNAAALELLGYTRDELLGRPFASISPERAVGEDGERELSKKDGERLPVSFASADLGGAMGGHVCLALDISQRKRMEVELRRSLAEKELLLREVHHRVKNNLQVVSSLLDLQARAIRDPAVLERFQASQDRIRSMVIIHDQLHRTEALDSIDLSTYLEQLVGYLAQFHVEAQRQVRLRTELEPVRIDLDRALACGLIVNELVTNALKHAFPAGRAGEVRVSCRAPSPGRVELAVADDGCGWQAGAEQGEGGTLGLSLVRTQVRQLKGTLAIDQERGTHVRVEFPAGPQERA
jgi:PAS domain S-box-containing protein